MRFKQKIAAKNFQIATQFDFDMLR